MSQDVNLLEYAEIKGWDDERLVKFMVDELGFENSQAWLNISILRGESKGDVVEGGE